MAYEIDPQTCTGCGACAVECPNKAISRKGKFYAIDPNKCTECQGHYDSPHCAEVCLFGAPAAAAPCLRGPTLAQKNPGGWTHLFASFLPTPSRGSRTTGRGE